MLPSIILIGALSLPLVPPATSPGVAPTDAARQSDAATAVVKPGQGARWGDRTWSKGDWRRFPKRIERAAICIARHESWHRTPWSPRLWRAQNAVSSASGFAQWIDGTWRVHAARAGVRGPSRAVHASPRQQARVFAANWPTSKKAWAGTGCPGT